MAKYILIRLINGTEYQINQKQQVIAVIDGLTGKKTQYEPSNDWTIKGMWYKKMFGGKDIIDVLQFITDAELIDVSINQTLTRSLFTSFTTFLTVLSLYIFGVKDIKDFALPIMVGVICGTYSSVLLSGNFWYMLSKAGKKE